MMVLLSFYYYFYLLRIDLLASETVGESLSNERSQSVNGTIQSPIWLDQKANVLYFAILKRHRAALFFNASWKYDHERLVK